MFSEGARVDDPMIQKEITEAELPDVSDFPAEVADSLPQYEKPEDAPKDSEPKWKLPDGELSEDRVRFNAIWDEIYHHPQQFDLDQGLPQIPPEMQDMVARAMIKAGRGTDVRLRLSRFGVDASFELLSEEVFLELAKKGVDDLSLDPFWNLSKKSISKIIEGGRGELILAHPDHFVSIPTDIARESLAKKGKNLYSIPSELLARANLDSGEVAEILLSNGGEEVVIQSFRIFKEEQKIPLAERLIKAGYGGKLLDSCYLLDDSLISNPDFSLLFIENGLAGQVSEMIRERKFPGTAEVIDKLTSLGYLDFFDGESFYGIKSISVGALKKILLERTDLKVSYLGDTKIVGAIDSDLIRTICERDGVNIPDYSIRGILENNNANLTSDLAVTLLGLNSPLLGKYVVERLDSLTDLTPELAQALITAGAPQRLIDLASKFPEFEIESLTEQFFTKREGLLALVQNLEKFPNVDQERLLAELENWRVYNEIFENLDSLTQIDRGELLKQTIEKGYSGGITAIIANLEKFDGLVDYQAFAVQLIEKGYANAVLDSLEKFKNIQGAELVDVLARFAPDSLVNCLDASALEKFEIDLPVLAETLIKRNKRGDLVAGNFLKFTGAEPQTIANLLLEAGNGKHLAMNLEKFAGIDINQAARRMLEDRESQYICANLEKFTGLDEKIKSEVLDDMVQYGNLEILIRNLSKFNGVTPEALAQKILENGAPFKVLQQLRLYLDLINDENREEMVKIGKQIIRRGLEEETITPEEIYIRAKDASYYGIGGKEIIEMLELDKYPQIPKTWEDVLTMLSFINASPDSLTGYQIVLTSDLRVGTVGYVNRGGIETIGSIREVFHQLLGKLDLGNLVARGLVKATPRGGDNVDIELIRNKALDLEAEDKPRLEIMHQMVHNYPGPKNLNVMRAYINFLNGSSVDEYNSYLSQIGEGEIWKPLEEADREELRHTLQLAQSIEQDLTVMYEPNPNTMKADLEKWKGTVELPELEVQADEIYDLFAKETPDDDLAALKKLSSLRASIAVAINELQGEARVQTYYFDINLEALGYTIFARMRERMDGDNLDNLEKIISLVEAGIAISLHDGYQTAETGRIASRVSAIEADFHAGKLNSDTRLGELRAAFDQWGDESARIIKGLEEVYKPSIKAGLLAKNETLPVQERLTDRELESRVVGVSSGLYRGTVLNILNDLLPRAILRMPEQKRMSARDMMVMLG